MSKKAMKLALEALEYIEHNYMSLPAPAEKAITALREALAEQPAQQEPLQNNPFDCGVYLGSGKDYAIKHHVSYGPAQQEPVAWTNWRELVGARHYRTPGWEMYADKRNPDDVAIYTSPPAQQEPLTDEEIGKCIDEVNATSQYGHHHFGWHLQFARAIEAAHGIKENT